jgi:hypothetical protein
MYLSKQHAAKSISTLTSDADYMDDVSGMGRQTTSNRKSQAQYGFGTSSRAHNSKVYMPPNF